MKKVASNLKSVAYSLSTLSKKVEKLSVNLNSQSAEKKKKDKELPKRKPTKTPRRDNGGGAGPGQPKKKAPTKKRSRAKTTVMDEVFSLIQRCKDSVDITSLKAKTGIESRQLSNALYKLSKKGLIKTKARGLYSKK